MNTEPQQQIAEKLYDELGVRIPKDRAVPMILQSIERANEFATLEEAQIEAAQPQCSEQQEWTPTPITGTEYWKIDIVDLDSFAFKEIPAKGISNAHNAALTAECQRREQIEREHDDNVSVLATANETIKQLAAKSHERRDQLLSALAANRKARKILEQSDVKLHIETVKALDSVDLSLLHELWKLLIDGKRRAICKHCGYPELIGSDDCRNCGKNFNERIEFGDEHDAEVRKPLVDALVALRDGPQRLTEWALRVIADALAKINQ